MGLSSEDFVGDFQSYISILGTCRIGGAKIPHSLHNILEIFKNHFMEEEDIDMWQTSQETCTFDV